MKKYLLAVSVLGIVGAATSVSARVDATNLPPDAKKIIEKIDQEEKNSKTRLNDFEKDLNTQLQATYQRLNKILAERGYLKQNELTEVIRNELKVIKDAIADVQKIETPSVDAKVWANNMNALLDILEKLPVPTGFPAECKSYRGSMVEGIVSKPEGRRGYEFISIEGIEDIRLYEFLSDITDVGLHGSGAEYTVGLTPNGSYQKAWLGKDPKTKKEVVVCLSNPIKVDESSEIGKKIELLDKEGK